MRLYIIILLLFATCLSAEVRAVWVTPWDIDTPAKCDKVIQTMKEANQNQLLAEVRYRSDAMYMPNREVCLYPNPDPRCYILRNSTFDALAYLIEKAKPENIEVHAWLTIMTASTTKVSLHSPDHLYYQHPEWFTWGPYGKMRPAEGNMGIFIDPGIPQVQEYLVNVIRDIVVNYTELDGIHLDYIRYPGRQYGKNPTSVDIYQRETEVDTPVAWHNWRREQINHLVQRMYAEVKSLSSNMELTAAVIANYTEAYNDYAQDWKQWLDGGYIDRVYLMAYTVHDLTMDKLLIKTQSFNHKDRTVIGVRTWMDNGTYPIAQILSKLFLVRDYQFAGTALFSFESMTRNNYWPGLTRDFFKEDAGSPVLPISSQKMVFGYVTNQDSLSIAGATLKIIETGVETTSDMNGFYAFTNLPEGTFHLDAATDEVSMQIDSLIVTAQSSVSRRDVRLQPLSAILLNTPVPSDTASVALDVIQVEEPVVETVIADTTFQDFAISTISDSSGVIILITNPKEQEIFWCIQDMNGIVQYSKRNTYLPGEVIEMWNGHTAEGTFINTGIYKIIAISGSDGKQVSKSVVLSRSSSD